MKALLIGATGLIGGRVLEKLLANDQYSRVFTVSRRHLSINHPKLVSVVTEFDTLIANPERFQDAFDVDHFICTLGTTLKTVNGDHSAFVKIDLEWPIAIAKLAKLNGARCAFAVSSLGANSHSGNLYTRTKGQLEEQLQSLEFPSCVVYQPSLLIGKRQHLDQPPRRGEAIGQALMPLVNPILLGKLRKYRGTPIDAVAEQILQDGMNPSTGFRRHYFTD